MRAVGLLLALVVFVPACSAVAGEGPRVVDEEAGLSYGLPEGWQQAPGDDLITFMSSSANNGEINNDGVLMLGPMERLFSSGAESLQVQAERTARDFGEFFVPFTGSSEVVLSQNAEVAGEPAHRVRLMIEPDDERPAQVEVIIVDLPDGAAYAVGIAAPFRQEVADEISRALDSLDKA